MQKEKKTWVQPEIEIITFSDVDIIVASTGLTDKPGHGWGDKNFLQIF